ncbi:carboxypeptidase regulatory-like domain-containing protein [Micromonospora soli]|uniref:MSCRAMM family protein n=1 Tax=Micromonospora sp. NBRC 110009 TaxID=3061627 RepID=UPI00267126F8|nr:carboxypeptidase regulatory-like domain-containing protein [Micromonospora sp. NBRC 110009]WKT99878.1 carboxypeptidase regulatory-like domain-containing protein [Micromonospora sp. NBRC 110009]
MSRSMLRRFGALLLGATLALTGLATPAQAADTGSITGQLTDGGAAVTGGSVYLYGDDVDHTDYAWLDDQGHYAFDAVPPGRYRVNFEAWGHPTQYAYGKTDWSSANLITVTAGGTTVVDDELLPVGTLTGRLVDRTGAPVQFASVGAEAVDYSSFGYGSTDPDGNFAIQVVPGSYRVRFDLGAFSQFAYGTLDPGAATVFAVTAGSTVTVNDTLVPTGIVAGRFTDTSGAPLSGVDVYVNNGQFFGSAQTDEDGRYRLDQVPVGTDYTVQFSSAALSVQQYAYGTVDSSAAARFAVTEGQTTAVDDQKLPTGSVRLTAVDSRTGQPILNFTSGIGLDSRDTNNGEVIYPDVPVGTHEIWASAPGYSFDGTTVTVLAGEQADVKLVMEPMARITATVVDAKTGTPLAGVCIVPVRVEEVRMPDGCGEVTDANGKVTQFIQRGAGTYQLLAWPDQAQGYGAQWLGPRGGTGDPRRATQFTVESGETVTPPVIQMDRAGVIAGQVFGPDGAALSHGAVRIAGEPVGLGSNFGVFAIGDEGHYRIDKLGPYEWPLLFDVPGQATQWSGGEGNRDRADRITVVAGGTTTYDYRLEAGVPLTVASTTPFSGYVAARNADTGDLVGLWWISEPNVGVVRQLMGEQRIRFEYYPAEGGRKFVGGEDFASAATYKIHKHKDAAFELTLG